MVWRGYEEDDLPCSLRGAVSFAQHCVSEGGRSNDNLGGCSNVVGGIFCGLRLLPVLSRYVEVYRERHAAGTCHLEEGWMMPGQIFWGFLKTPVVSRCVSRLMSSKERNENKYTKS